MAVQATATEHRCKLCRHSKRAEIDALLEQRSNRAKLDDGTVVNADYVLAQLAEMGVQNPTNENIKTHWRKHCAVISDDAAAALTLSRQNSVAAVARGERAVVDPDAFLDFIIDQAEQEARIKLEVDGKAGITIDQGIKAVQEKTRRKENEAQQQLLGELGAGISKVFGAVADAAGKQLVDAEAETIEDAEFEEVPVRALPQ